MIETPLQCPEHCDCCVVCVILAWLSDLCGLSHLILRLTLGVRYFMIALQMSQLWFRDINMPKVTHLGDKVTRLRLHSPLTWHCHITVSVVTEACISSIFSSHSLSYSL